ncbi:MAG: hypothetical protein K6G86_07825 [Bacteroidales bacterium]|nr:hypothetical protein [Bacteroidales bacterium]
MELDVLYADYMHCRSNKRRSADCVQFDLHRERNLGRLHSDVNDRTLPALLYSWITHVPRDREVNACLMEIKTIQDHFDQRVRPLVEEELTDRTFNNRVGYGPEQAINQLLTDIYEVSEGFTRDCWVISRDISAFFPSGDLARTHEQYRALIERRIPEGPERDDLLWILRRVVYTYPSINSHLRSPRWLWDECIAPGKSVVLGKDPGRGGCLGHQFWQVAMMYDLNEFDHRQEGMRYVRFVDDMRWVVADKEAGLAYVAGEEKWLLENYGYRMHPLKRQVQHYTKGGEFISAHYRMDRVYVGNRTVRRAFARLAQWNERPRLKNLEHFLQSVNSYLGIFKNRNAYGILRNFIDAVSPAWWLWCEYDDNRKAVVARPGFRHNELLLRKYHFKLSKAL